MPDDKQGANSPGERRPVDNEYVARQRAIGFADMQAALRAAAAVERARRQARSAAKPTTAGQNGHDDSRQAKNEKAPPGDEAGGPADDD
jgi:hypothetical protein